MRRLSALAILMLCSAGVRAADLTATSRVDQVTVFLSGAEVTRLAKVSVDKGEHVLTIVDVPASAVAGSIRVEGAATGKLDITSVDTQRKYLARADAQAADAERKKIEDEIETLRDEKAAIDAAIAAADTQKALIANLAQLPTRPAPAAGAAAPAKTGRASCRSSRKARPMRPGRRSTPRSRLARSNGASRTWKRSSPRSRRPTPSRRK